MMTMSLSMFTAVRNTSLEYLLTGHGDELCQQVYGRGEIHDIWQQ